MSESRLISSAGVQVCPRCYVVKTVASKPTSSMVRTYRSQRSRELGGRMTGGALISGVESTVVSRSLGRNS